ncbi:MAG: SDR family oxidoreductase [Acidobacteriota bacterium]|nr:SDR family oxidoreductase [Acidobacteriota bacterium]
MTGFELKGATALVTGAARRLGMYCAVALAERGCNVVVHYHASAEDAEGLCRRLRGELEVGAWAVRADLSTPLDAETLMRSAREVAGPVNVLINSASVFERAGLQDATFDDLTRNCAINSWAPFVLSRALAAQGVEGRIINLLDTRVEGYDFAHVPYILSKHMLSVLTRMTALEYAPKVTVNAIAPGLILPPPGQDEAYLKRLADTVPLKRHGGHEDIVRAMLFLIDSHFITGQTVFVDGGAHLKGA